MANPMRLDAALVAAAERESKVQKRSVPKQIEFWAELGRTLEHIIGIEDMLAIVQGFKNITLSPSGSTPVNPDDVFDTLEHWRDRGSLSEAVTSACVFYEASRTRPGLLDRVDTSTGDRQSGQFRNGVFEPK